MLPRTEDAAWWLSEVRRLLAEQFDMPQVAELGDERLWTWLAAVYPAASPLDVAAGIDRGDILVPGLNTGTEQ